LISRWALDGPINRAAFKTYVSKTLILDCGHATLSSSLATATPSGKVAASMRLPRSSPLALQM
jgi:hypothetical protein